MSERKNDPKLFGASVLVAGAIMAMAMVMASLGSLDPAQRLDPLIRQAMVLAIAVGGVAALGQKMTGARPQVGRVSPRVVLLSVLAGVALSWLGTGVMVVEAALIPSWEGWFERKSDMFQTLLGDNRWSRAPLVFFALAMTPAVVEEWLFRGVLRTHLKDALSVGGRVVFIGALFSLYHVDITVVLPMFYVGAMLTLVGERTGGWIAPVIVHMSLNAFSALVWTRVSADRELSIWMGVGMVLVGCVVSVEAIRRIAWCGDEVCETTDTSAETV